MNNKGLLKAKQRGLRHSLAIHNITRDCNCTVDYSSDAGSKNCSCAPVQAFVSPAVLATSVIDIRPPVTVWRAANGRCNTVMPSHL